MGHLLSRELPSVLESITRSITTNIIRDQMSLSEEWTRKSMVSLLTLFPHLTPLSEALLHSCQMVLMNLLSRVLHSTREDTTATRDQMSLREEWMRKSMVSLLTPFHHSTPELEALCHSFQTVLTHLPTMVSLPSLERETLLRETPTGMFTVSFMTKFQLLTLGRDTHMVTFQTVLTHLLSKVLLPSEKKKDKKEEEEAKEADANEKKEKKEESLQQVKKTLAQVKEDGDKKEEKKEPVAAPEKVHVLEPTVYQDKANTNTPNKRTTFYDKKKDDTKTKM